MVLCQGIPLFVFRLPVFSPLYEFFLQSLLVFILFKTIKQKVNLSLNFWALFGIGIATGLITLVRFNNIFATIVWPIVLLINSKAAIKKVYFWRALLFTYVVAAMSIIAFKILPDYYNLHHAYGLDFLFKLTKSCLFTLVIVPITFCVSSTLSCLPLALSMRACLP